MLIFLYGEDTFRSRRKLNELKNKFIREVDPSGNSVIILGGGGVTVEKISEAVGTPSLFSRRRMIIVEKVVTNKDKTFRHQALAYFKKLAEREASSQDNIIVVWSDAPGAGAPNDPLFKLLSGLKYAQNFKPLSNTDIAGWIKSEVEARGGKIKNKAATNLAGLVGNDLWRLSNEIDKLLGYRRGREEGLIAGGGATVEIEEGDVEKLVLGNFNENIFALTDALSGKRGALAMKLFEQEVAAGAAEGYLMHMIIRQFRVLLQVRQALDLGHSSKRIIGELKLHPYVVQKCLLQARGFSLPFLKKIFGRLVETDRAIKFGEIETKTAITMLIAKI